MLVRCLALGVNWRSSCCAISLSPSRMVRFHSSNLAFQNTTRHEPTLNKKTIMSTSDSLPVYDGPKCRICCDLMPNRQIPLPNGKWVDVQKQGKMTLSLAVWLSDVYESAKTCVNCTVMIEALECFEGKEPRLEDDMFTVDGRVGTSLKLEYNLADVEYLRFIEVFSDTGEKIP